QGGKKSTLSLSKGSSLRSERQRRVIVIVRIDPVFHTGRKHGPMPSPRPVLPTLIFTGYAPASKTVMNGQNRITRKKEVPSFCEPARFYCLAVYRRTHPALLACTSIAWSE